MLGRRGSSLAVQIVIVAVILVSFFYGFVLYQNSLTRLDRLEKDNSNLAIEKEDLTRDVQLLRDTQEQLKLSLQQKEEECISQQTETNEMISEMKRQDRQEKKNNAYEASRLKSHSEGLQQALDDSEHDKTDLKGQMERKVEEMNVLMDESRKNERVKEQECENEIALIKDEAANCKRKLAKMPPTKNKEDPKVDLKGAGGEEEEDQKLQIQQPGGDLNREYIKRSNSSPPFSPVQGGLLSGQKKNASEGVNQQVAPPVIKSKLPNEDIEHDTFKIKRGLPQGEGGFHGDGDHGGQVEAPKGVGNAKGEAVATNKDTIENESRFRPIPPAVKSDNGMIKPRGIEHRNNNKELKNEAKNGEEDNDIKNDNKEMMKGGNDDNNNEDNNENNYEGNNDADGNNDAEGNNDAGGNNDADGRHMDNIEIDNEKSPLESDNEVGGGREIRQNNDKKEGDEGNGGFNHDDFNGGGDVDGKKGREMK